MTDEETDAGESAGGESSPETDTTDRSVGESSVPGPDRETALRYVQLGALALLALFALVSAWGVYTSVGRVIDIWVDRRFAPLFRAAFNLAVLLVATAGVFRLVRELD